MKNSLTDDKPIYLQIKEQIEDAIIDEKIKAGERIPSTNELAHFYKINPATAGKGMNELVSEQVLVKRRGVGMFVTENAKEILMEKRRQSFYETYMLPLKREARKLKISRDELAKMVDKEDSHED